MTQLAGKVAIVTGGGTGIGQAIAVALAREGARLVAVGRRVERVQETCRMIDDQGGESLPLSADVSKSPEVERVVNVCVERFGGVDILVNNAGTRAVGGVLSLSEDDWDRVMDTNLKGVFLCSKLVAPLMVKNKWGRIVNISSVAAITPSPNVAYSTSKGAMVTLTKSMALELSPKGINVNVICPGTVVTDMTRGMLSDAAVHKEQLTRSRVGRFGDPSEIASAVLYLCSAGSGFVTGSVLVVDGGWTIA